MAKIKNKQELISKIKNAEGFSNEEKSQMLALLNESKTYGLVWEDSTEDAWEKMKDYVPVLKEDESKRLDHGSENPNHILIEGDNLNALTALSYTHEGKIDVIYIDPPYNTGATTWKYNNDFVDKDDAFRHSKWLSMMHHRLVIAKRLLNSENSALIVTIDEVECANLSCMLQELFPYAKTQMVTSVICPGGRGKKAGEDLSNTEEFIFFVRIGDCTVLPEIKDETSTPLGWRSLIRGTLANGRGKHGIGSCGPNQFYPIYVDNSTKKIVKVGDPLPENVSRYTAPELEGCTAVFPIRPDGTEMNWGCVPEEAIYRLENGYLRVGSYTPSKPQPYVIQYLTKGVIRDIQEGKAIITGRNQEGYVEGFYPEGKPTMPTTVWNRPTHNATQYGTNLLTSILGSQMFDYPKSLYAVMDCVRFISGRNKNAKILDFFAGSGTTLHASMQLNAEDGGHRQCILVTNNENNICEEVTYERNKRVIEGYTTPKGEFVEGLKDNNLRYFKVGFTPREKTDENMFRLAKNSVNLLRIKHDVYKETQFGALENPYKRYRYFEEDGKQLLVILDTELIGDIVEQLEEMEVSKPIPTYVFTTGAYPFTEDFDSVADKVELYPLPHGLCQACERNMPKMTDKEIENPDGISLSNEELETSMDDLTKEEA